MYHHDQHQIQLRRSSISQLRKLRRFHVRIHTPSLCAFPQSDSHSYDAPLPIQCLHTKDLTFAYPSRFILLGILISYLPQHHRIISRRSSQGISPYFVLLGTTSGTCAFANVLTLPTSQADLACCSELSGFECFAGLLGIAQVGIQWSCFAVMYVPSAIISPSVAQTQFSKEQT